MSDLLTGAKTRLINRVRNISPVQAAFVCSLLLSAIAIITSPTLNRDGMLYVDTARVFQESGFAAAKANFNWPFLPILMACVSWLTGLNPEFAGYLINSLFMAGTMALMVACARRQFPEAIWPICLVLLALPGLNHYRDEILREYGCWFFSLLSFWLALLWSATPRWKTVLALQISLGISALFRPEALAFFPALILWQVFSAPKGDRSRRFLMLAGLPLIALVVFLMLSLNGQLSVTDRLSGEFSRFSMARFDAKAKALAEALIPYARDQARTILLFGSLAIIPLKFVKQMGIFILPLLFLISSPSLRTALIRWQLFVWVFLAHLLILAVFVVDLQFLAGRYVIVLHLLSAPLIGFGLWLFMQRFPRWGVVFVVLSGLLMLSNVASFSPKKNHFSEAGAWLSANVTKSPRIYSESPRTAYYAGWSFLQALGEVRDRSLLSQALAEKKYDLLVLEISSSEPDIDTWLNSAGLQEVRRFSHSSREAVLIAEPKRDPAQDKAAKTERIRRKTDSIE